MERTLIQQHTTALIKGLIERSRSLRDLDHKLLKGELREIFVSNLLKSLLPTKYEVGSGVIVNQRGVQSSQLDVILYDPQFLPPFIKEYNLGVYPAESVLAVIEVKSVLNNNILSKINKKNKKILEMYDRSGSVYPEFSILKPLLTVFGFYSDKSYTNEDREEINDYIYENCKYVDGVCLLNEYSWFSLSEEKTKNHLKIKNEHNEETKSFISILLDNIITNTKRREYLERPHYDFYSIYIRDQPNRRKEWFPNNK